jgi:Domain of unknown function (DUF4831)
MYKFITLFLLYFVTNVHGQNINYFSPKKIIYITVPFTITEKKLWKVDQNGKQSYLLDMTTIVNVDGEIKVDSKIYPGLYQNLNIDRLGKGGKSFDFAIKFDDDGNGSISTINANQTPATGEIIKGTVNVIGSLIKVVGGLLGAAAGEDTVQTKEESSEQKILEVRTIEITDDKPVIISISPSLIVAEDNLKAIPASVVVSITKSSKVITPNNTNNIKLDEPSKLFLHYRIPAEHTIQIKVLNNQLIKEQVIIEDKILIPQTGTEVIIDIPILKKKKTFEIGFNTKTGNLSNYGLTKGSQLKENFDNINDGIGTLNTEISNLKTAIAENKKEAEDAKKKEVEDNKDKTLKAEIESLKLEKATLDLLLEKQNLLDELAEKKKPHDESAKAKKGKKS